MNITFCKPWYALATGPDSVNIDAFNRPVCLDASVNAVQCVHSWKNFWKLDEIEYAISSNVFSFFSLCLSFFFLSLFFYHLFLFRFFRFFFLLLLFIVYTKNIHANYMLEFHEANKDIRVGRESGEGKTFCKQRGMIIRPILSFEAVRRHAAHGNALFEARRCGTCEPRRIELRCRHGNMESQWYLERHVVHYADAPGKFHALYSHYTFPGRVESRSRGNYTLLLLVYHGERGREGRREIGEGTDCFNFHVLLRSTAWHYYSYILF